LANVSGPNSTALKHLRQLRDTPELIQQLHGLNGSELSIQQKLRSLYDAHLVPAGIALHESRGKAAALLPCGDQLWVTRTSLEQATAWQVAQHKMTRFPPGEHVTDLCSGIGVDAAALLSRGPVTTTDLDPAMAQRCEWNMDIWRDGGVISRDFTFEQLNEDAHQISLAGKLIHADPDRRDGHDRPVKRLEQYFPNLDWMQNAVQTAAGGALKLGPASNFMQKFPGCQIELISLNGECKEATVWFGSLAEDSPFRATVLPTGESVAADPLSGWCESAQGPLDYIFDPDPAVVRSGLLDVIGEIHNLHRLDREDEYLTGTEVPATAFVRSFRVEAVLPNNLRDIKKYFRATPARNYEVKCRHLHVDASAIQKKLPRGDGEPRVVFFVRVNGKAQVVIAERL
jgi:hypothetical protein